MTKRKVRSQSQERLQELDDSIPRPVLSALTSCRQERLAKMEVVAKELSESPPIAGEDVRAAMAQLKQLALEAKEINDWITTEIESMPDDERERKLKAWADAEVRAGKSLEEVLKLLEEMMKRPRGRPATSRVLAIEALEMKLSHPDWSWGRIANKLCPCGKEPHGVKCKDKIRLAVGALQNFLTRMDISVPLSEASR